MIWKKSQMDLGATVVIEPQQLKKENIAGQYGPQNEWWVKVNGENATTYTGVGDMYDSAFLNALGGGNVSITKSFDKTKNRAKYDIKLEKGSGVAPTPTQPAKPASTPTQGTQQSNQYDGLLYKAESIAKGYKIAYQGVGKFVGNPESTPEENHSRITTQYQMMEEWAENKTKEQLGLVSKLKAIIARSKVEGDITQWICNRWQVDNLNRLDIAIIIKILMKWDKLVALYTKSVQGATEALADRQEPPPEPEKCPEPAPLSEEESVSTFENATVTRPPAAQGKAQIDVDDDGIPF